MHYPVAQTFIYWQCCAVCTPPPCTSIVLLLTLLPTPSGIDLLPTQLYVVLLLTPITCWHLI